MLTGANSLIVGSTRANGAGTVILLDNQNLTAGTTIHQGSTLQTNLVNALGVSGSLIFSGEAVVLLGEVGTAQLDLNVAGFTRSAGGVLLLQRSGASAANLGAAPGTANSVRLVDTTGALAGLVVNDMLPAYFLSDTDSTFLNYGPNAFSGRGLRRHQHGRRCHAGHDVD